MSAAEFTRYMRAQRHAMHSAHIPAETWIELHAAAFRAQWRAAA